MKIYRISDMYNNPNIQNTIKKDILLDNVMYDATYHCSSKLVMQPTNTSLRPSGSADASILHAKHDSGSQKQSKFKTCSDSSTVFSDRQADAQQMQDASIVSYSTGFGIYAVVADDARKHAKYNDIGFNGVTPNVCAVSKHLKILCRSVVIGTLNDNAENYNILLVIQGAVTQANSINPNEFYNLTASLKYNALIVFMMTCSTTVHDACPDTSMPIIAITFDCP